MTPEAEAILRLIEVQRTMLTAEYQLLRGTTAEMAMQLLAEAEQLVQPDGDTT